MLSTYRVSNSEHDLKDFKKSREIEVVKPDSAVNRTTIIKIEIKVGRSIKINENYLDEILHNNNL